MQLLLHKALGLAATLLIGGLLGATLVRLSPGWDVDERELDTRRSEESLSAIRQENASHQSVLRFYSSYMAGILMGDFGTSRVSHEPVRSVIADRAPVTLKTAGVGYLLAWLSSLALALTIATGRWALLETITASTSGLLLSLPAACLGFFALWTGIGPEWAVAAAIFPKLYRYSSALLKETYARPHVITAFAKGLSSARILLAHVLRPALSELLALAGATVSLAFGAAIPLEVVCDSPGLGHLAWQAATARDLPVLVALTLLVTLVVKSSSIAADLFRIRLRESRP